MQYCRELCVYILARTNDWSFLLGGVVWNLKMVTCVELFHTFVFYVKGGEIIEIWRCLGERCMSLILSLSLMNGVINDKGGYCCKCEVNGVLVWLSLISTY